MRLYHSHIRSFTPPELETGFTQHICSSFLVFTDRFRSFRFYQMKMYLRYRPCYCGPAYQAAYRTDFAHGSLLARAIAQIHFHLVKPETSEPISKN